MHRFDPQHMLQQNRGAFKPEDLLRDFLPGPHAILADIGCGPGFFSLPAALMLPDGKVVAVDLQQDSLDMLADRAQAAGIKNIETIRADAQDLPLADASVDAVLMSRFLNNFPQRDAILREARRVLRPAGLAYFVQWDRVQTPMGPPFTIRIAADEMQQILRDVGFEVERLWPGPAPFYRVLAKVPEQG